MRVAPSVVADLPGSRRWRWGLPLLGAASGACAALAVAPHAGLSLGTAGALIALFALIGGGWAAPLARAGAGRLAWDGSTWRFTPAGETERIGQLRVMIDLGGWMLLRLEVAGPEAGARRHVVWLPVADASLPQGPALRAAVYCRPLNAENAASPGPATR
jgi:hypothetical protein